MRWRWPQLTLKVVMCDSGFLATTYRRNPAVRRWLQGRSREIPNRMKARTDDVAVRSGFLLAPGKEEG